MGYRNIETVEAFLEHYQKDKNTQCIIHFLDTFIDFDFVKNYKFQFTNGLFFNTFDSTCNVFICTEKYLESSESQKIDQDTKNHLWIIDGNYMKKSLKWPVLEVTSKLTKLHCPGDLDAKLITKHNINLCTEYPTLNGGLMHVSVVGFKPNLLKVLPDGSFIGFFRDSIDMLSEYVHYKPKYILGARTWDEVVMEVNNGTADMGVKTTMTKKRFDLVDFPAYIDFVELVYIAPTPKPVDILYQLIQPFSVNVWLAWLATLFAYCILFYFVTKLFLWKPKVDTKINRLASKNLNEIKGIDFLLYPFGMLFEPLLNDIKWIRILWERTASGKMITIGLVIGSFLVMNIYRTVLLSYLTAISVEKPINTVRELIDSDYINWHFAGEITQMLKDSPGEEYREMYEKATKYDWIVDNNRMDQTRRDYLAGTQSFQVKSYNIFWLNSVAIKKTGKPLYKLSKEPCITAQSSIIVPKNGPMTKTFEKYISRSFDHGVFKKLRYHYQLREGNTFLMILSKTSIFFEHNFQMYCWIIVDKSQQMSNHLRFN